MTYYGNTQQRRGGGEIDHKQWSTLAWGGGGGWLPPTPNKSLTKVVKTQIEVREAHKKTGRKLILHKVFIDQAYRSELDDD